MSADEVRCPDCGATPCGYPGECGVLVRNQVVLEGSETAAVIEALGHYRDLLRAEGKEGAAYVAALGKICSFVTPASDTIILSAP